MENAAQQLPAASSLRRDSLGELSESVEAIFDRRWDEGDVMRYLLTVAMRETARCPS
jgi:hypothetical protein